MARLIPSKALSPGVAAWCAASVALLWHAASYDFFCDDGFIALRYSQTLLTTGELAYNPGERVEGFTSPLWVVLVALLGVFGGSLVTCAKILGAASAVGTLAVTRQLWRFVAPQHSSAFAFVVLGLLVISPSFSAWTMGGLEAPLFALGVTSTLVLLARAYEGPSVLSWLQCGVVVALAGLARPEGMALAALCVGLALLESVRARTSAYVVACALPVVFILGGYFAFRLGYYGYPFPNTYYVKTSGGAGLSKRGVAYVTAMAWQFGWPTCAALGVALIMPLLNLKRVVEATKLRPSFGVLALLTRALVVGFVFYLVRIGGDFLDLYRFLVPVLPLAFCLIVSELLNIWHQAPAVLARVRRVSTLLADPIGKRGLSIAMGLVCGALLLSFSKHSLWLGVRTTKAQWYSVPRDAPSRPKGVESIAYTREAALQWVALGRALRQHAKRHDTMAMGAAGAGPFAAKLPNLDLYGLTDSWVAHHGRVVGSRPGHQRFASRGYIRKWKPTYLLLQRSGSVQPTADAYWNRAGYKSATLKVSRRKHGAVRTHYISVLVHNNRAKFLKNSPDWKFL